MSEHIIKILPDTDGTPVPYNPIAKIQWVLVDEKDKVPLFCETEANIDMAIARLYTQLNEEDRRNEEEKLEQPKIYSKGRLYLVLTEMGLWNTLKEWMQSQTLPNGVNVWEAFNLHNDLASDHPLFTQFLAQAQSILGIDDATVAEILAAAQVEN